MTPELLAYAYSQLDAGETQWLPVVVYLEGKLAGIQTKTPPRLPPCSLPCSVQAWEAALQTDPQSERQVAAV